MEKRMTAGQQQELLDILRNRFEKNMKRHKGLVWKDIEEKLLANPGKLWSIGEMERTGGEPDIVDHEAGGSYVFYDCSPESPAGRRSLCYDREALESRKENAPRYNVVDMAAEMGIELLTEEAYRHLQQAAGPFDGKTSSWIKTPPDIRKAGGAVYCDFRYGHVFLYHNGASSYYANRGFRGLLSL